VHQFQLHGNMSFWLGWTLLLRMTAEVNRRLFRSGWKTQSLIFCLHPSFSTWEQPAVYQ